MKKETGVALLFDYEFCSGCHTCEIACQKEHGFGPGEFGVELRQLGPVELEPKVWQYDNIPVPTDRCDHCLERVEKGTDPTCVKHCQAGCIAFGPVEELAARMTGTHMALFTVA